MVIVCDTVLVAVDVSVVVVETVVVVVVVVLAGAAAEVETSVVVVVAWGRHEISVLAKGILTEGRERGYLPSQYLSKLVV